METAEDGFDSFVRTRTHALLRSAYLLTGDQQLAEDLVQSALSRTHQSWKRLTDTGNAESYARRTMYHLQVSWWRRRRVAEVMPARMPDGPGTDDHAGAVSLRLALQAALLQLSARQRAVLVLRFFEDHTEREAADLLGVSIGTVKSQTAKALARLRGIAPELADVDSRGITGRTHDSRTDHSRTDHSRTDHSRNDHSRNDDSRIADSRNVDSRNGAAS